ncbi:MotE family protein [Bacillus kexueae]|uniref:MotE family protein n=1 Tax=Aeribacillus kexueae TaxID=2078952 RepID=UPI001FB01A17|nr:hypothetical protein [Bacillus kexueae]
MENEEKSLSKLQWFLIIVTSSIVTLVFIYFILYMVGIDPLQKVKEKAKTIPIISNYIDKEENPISELEQITREFEKEKEQFTKTIDEQQQMITALEKDLQLKEDELSELQAEFHSLQSELNALNREGEQKVDITSIYEEMNPSKAAESIAVLSDESATQILTSLKQETIARILEKMDVQDRARMTKLLQDSN